VRLPGAGGAPEIAASTGQVIVIVKQSTRTFVERLDFITSVGHRSGDTTRRELGFTGAGPTVVITDLGVLRPDPSTCELTLTQLHAGVTVEQARQATGWSLAVAPDLPMTPPPTEEEMTELRRLKASYRRST
jgi:glutaconate CoA-transferase, subunit B